jgi:CRISPR/Cas system CSM-associated protein Csm2 small subunit
MKDEAKTKLENLPTTQLCEFYIEVQEEEMKAKDSRKEVRDDIQLLLLAS